VRSSPLSTLKPSVGQTTVTSLFHRSSKAPFLMQNRHVSALQMLLTIIAILAVDFSIFPRRFGKTETYGTGLVSARASCFYEQLKTLYCASIGTCRGVRSTRLKKSRRGQKCLLGNWVCSILRRRFLVVKVDWQGLWLARIEAEACIEKSHGTQYNREEGN
jgi:hypothetical protein